MNSRRIKSSQYFDGYQTSIKVVDYLNNDLVKSGDIIIDKTTNKLFIIKKEHIIEDKSKLEILSNKGFIAPVEAEILKITKPTIKTSADYGKPGDTIILQASGSHSPDSSNITYHWILPDGSESTGDSLNFVIPSSAKDGDKYQILCYATDDVNNKSPATIAEIEAVSYYPPVIDSINWDRDILVAEQNATATVNAHDPNLDTLSYSCVTSDEDIVITQNGNKFTFKFPNKDTHSVDFTFTVTNSQKSISKTVTKKIEKITEKNLMISGTEYKNVAIRQIDNDSALWIVNKTGTDKQAIFIKFNFASIVDWFSIGGVNVKDDYNVSPVVNNKVVFVSDDNKIFKVDIVNKTLEKVVEINDVDLTGYKSGVDNSLNVLFAKSSSDYKWVWYLKLDQTLNLLFAKKCEINKTGSKYSDSYRLPVYDIQSIAGGIGLGYYLKGAKDISMYGFKETGCEDYYAGGSGVADWNSVSWDGKFIDMSYKNSSIYYSIPMVRKNFGLDKGYQYVFGEGDKSNHRFVAVLDESTPMFIVYYGDGYFIVSNKDPNSFYQKAFLPLPSFSNVTIKPESQKAVSFPTYNLLGISFETSSSVGIKLFYNPIKENKKKCNTLIVEDITVKKVSSNFFRTKGSYAGKKYLPSGYQYYVYDFATTPTINDITSSYSITDKPTLPTSSCFLTKRIIVPNSDLQPFSDNSCIIYYNFDGNANNKISGNFNGEANKVNFTLLDGLKVAYLHDMDSYIRFQRPISSTTSPFTVTFLLKAFSYYGGGGGYEQVQIFGCRKKYSTHNSKDFMLQVKNGSYGKIRLVYGNNDTVKDSNVIVSDNKWHFIALVYTGSKFTLYVDGNKVFDLTGATEITNECSYWYIGNILPEISSSHSPSSVIGYIANFRVFNRALSSSEINSLFEIQYVK